MSLSDPKSLLQDTSFEPNAILRGAQLTFVGAFRALQNPGLFTSEHYRQAALAVVAGILIRLLLAIPTFAITVIINLITLVRHLEHPTWTDDVVNGIHYIEHHVLQVPFFLMTLLRYLSPAMDQMFMDSLAWVDKTYLVKHKNENPEDLRAMYYPNLKLYENSHDMKGKTKEQRAWDGLQAFLWRFGKRGALSLAVYLASFLPIVGRFVLPAASFYTFNNSVGTPAAVVIFGSGILVPKRYLIMFLQSYFSSRTLMRELLQPYFSRIHYAPGQKRAWFHDRSGVLYGFAFAFYLLLRIPLVGVLIYGVAEASTAYLITKITEPPPPPADEGKFKEEDVKWKNKKEFLSLPVDKLDRFNIAAKIRHRESSSAGNNGDVKGREFT